MRVQSVGKKKGKGRSGNWKAVGEIREKSGLLLLPRFSFFFVGMESSEK